jgi:hypothetical protein
MRLVRQDFIDAEINMLRGVDACDDAFGRLLGGKILRPVHGLSQNMLPSARHRHRPCMLLPRYHTDQL